MSASLIGLIFTGVIALILLSSIFFGIKRGLKKTLFRFFWLLLTGVGAYFVTPIVSNWLNSFDISSLGLDIYGKVNKLSDIGLNIVNNLTAGEAAFEGSAVLQSLAENLPTIILNIVVFVVLFWVLKIVLWPIWAIIASRLFDTQEREQKKFKKQQAKLRAKNDGVQPPQEENMPILLQVKPKKIRWGGAVIGIIIGLLLSAVAFTPFVGFNAIYQNVYANLKTEKDGEKVSLIETSIEDKEVLEYLSSYENSIGNQILTYTGMSFLSDAMFGGLATVNAGEEKIYLADEVDTVIKVYNRYETIKSFNPETVTQESLDEVLTAVKEIFIDARGSRILYILGDDILPYYIDEYLNDENFKLVDGEDIDDIIVSAYNSYVLQNKFKLIEVQAQAESIVDVITVLNNSDLIVPFIKGEVNSAEAFVDLISKNVGSPELFAKRVVDNLNNVTILKNKYPELVDSGIEALFNMLEIDYREQHSASVDLNALNTNIKTVLSNSIAAIKEYANSKDYVFEVHTMEDYLGRVIDTLKDSLLYEENYNTLIDYLINKANEATKDIADFSTIINKAKEVESWETELYSLLNLYNRVMILVNDNITFEKIMSDDYNKFEEIGDGLRSAMAGGNPSKLVSNETIREAIEIILTQIDTSSFDEVLNVVVEDGKTLKDTILDNIYNETTKQTTIENWALDFEYTFKVFKNVYKIVEGNFDLNQLSLSQNNQLKNLGKSIDNALDNTNLILTNEVIRNIADYYLKKVEFGLEIDEILNIRYGGTEENPITVYDQILNNIYNFADSTTAIDTWEFEFEKIKKVINANFDTSNLPALGAILNKISDSRVLSKSVITEVVKKYIADEALALGDGFEAAITAMKNNVSSIENYEEEFRYITEVIEVLNADYSGNNRAKFEAIGAKFNTVTNVQLTETKQSKLFTKAVVNEFIKHYFDKFVNDNLGSVDEDLVDIINTITAGNNLTRINDYKAELLYIIDLVDCVDGSIPDKNQDTESTLADIGYILDTIHSEIITTPVIRDIISYYYDEETSSIDADIKVNLSSVKTNIKNTEIVVRSYQKEFAYIEDLITVINANPLVYGDIGKVFNNICNATGAENGYVSAFISRTTLETLLTHYLTEFASEELEENDTELKAKIDDIIENIASVRDFEVLFTELDNVVAALAELKVLNSIDNFTNPTLIGEKLDILNAMTVACDKTTTYTIANKLIEILTTDDVAIAEVVNNVINNEVYDFANYNSDNYAGTYEGSTYYKDLMLAIKDAIDNPPVTE